MRIKTFKSLLSSLALVLLTTLAYSNVALAQDSIDSAPAEATEAAAADDAGAGAWPSAEEDIIKKGKELFSAKCNSCHELNKKVTGPALANVSDRRSQDWLYKWIRNNEEFRKSGDPDALAIYEEFAGSPMTIFADLKDADIDAIVSYTKYADKLKPAGGPTAGGPVEVAADPVLVKKVNTTLLIIAFFILLIVVLILEILNLVSRLTGKEIIKWNNVNAVMMILFLIAGMSLAFWELFTHGVLVLPAAASEHGVLIDNMMEITFILTGIVFVITQILLFGWSFAYRKNKNRKAFYYPHNNKLEVIWTVIPAIALTILVLAGLDSWQKIMYAEDDAETQEFEIFAYQFGWKARTAGADGEMGKFNYNLISGTNPLGLGINEEYKKLLGEDIPGDIKLFKEQIAELEALPSLTDEQEDQLADLKEKLHLKERHLARLGDISADTALFSDAGYDDIIYSDEIHVMKNKPVHFTFRARDVIHSAYLPYFRLQMNCVPGMPTQFTFTPTKSTSEMQVEKNDPEWNYYLFCAKICGKAHYKMKMKVVVHDETDQEGYDKWIEDQKGYFASYKAPAVEETPQVAEEAEGEAETNENTDEVSEEVALLNR